MTATVATSQSLVVAGGSLFCRFFVVGFSPAAGVLASMHARRLVGERLRGAGGRRQLHLRGSRGIRKFSGRARGHRPLAARTRHGVSLAQWKRSVERPVHLARGRRDGLLRSGPRRRARRAASARHRPSRAASRSFDRRRRRLDDGYPVEPDVSWFAVARDKARVVGTPDPVRSLPLDAGAEAVIVDSGRARLYRPLLRPEALASITIEPDVVLRVCSELQVKGICFYARTGGPTVALRVFTVSLAGGEDAATGGAVLGLSALL